MKKVLLFISIIIAVLVGFTYNTQDAHSNQNGAVAGATGSPGDGVNLSCARSGCHTGTGNPVSNSTNATISSTIPATGYIPGQTYTITGTVLGAGLTKFGFEISPQTTGGTQCGSLIVTNSTATQLVGSGKYITHKLAGTTGTTGSHTWTFNWVAPVANTGAFSFYGAFNATNNSNSKTGDIIYLEELAITEAAQISVQPTATSACAGGNAVFSVTATGSNLTYLWKKNGNPLANSGTISGATSNQLTITGVSALDIGNYSVDVTGSGNTIPSNAVGLTVNDVTAINTQPQPQTICQGSNTFLTVDAVGTNLSYQWKKGTTNVGTNSSTLNLNNAVPADGGTYSVVVTGSCGTATSTSVLVTVNPSTLIATQPQTQTLCTGATLNLSVSATGTGTLTYVWKRGSTVVGGNSPSLQLTNLTTGDAGSYTCTVTGGCGTAISSAAVITINTATAITTTPVTQTICQGSNTFLTVSAVGTNLSYQWKKGTSNVGTNSSTLNINNALPTDGGQYTVTVTGDCGSITTTPVAVTVNPTTAITTQPITQNACTGSNVTFSVVADGVALNYQWFRGVTPIGSNSPSVTLTGISVGDQGNYSVVISGGCGNATSTNAALTVVNSASISQQPQATSFCEGGPLNLTVIGNGGNNTTYQWRRNGIAINNATSATYQVNNATSANEGTYNVVITGSCGTITSNTVTVTMAEATSVNNILGVYNLCAGQAQSFSVSANGTNLNYQWFKNDTIINGATNTGINIPNVSAADTGLYKVVVTGNCGVVTANIAIVHLATPPQITGISMPLPMCQGSAVDLAFSATGGSLSYQWFKNGALIQDAIGPSYSDQFPNNGDSYTCSVWNTCDSINSGPIVVVVLPLPNPVITLIAGPSVTTGAFVAYSWYFNGQIITNSNSQTINISQIADEGDFTVIVTDANGCSDTSAIFHFIPSGIAENPAKAITIYPNPTNGDVYFNTPIEFSNFTVKIVSATGQLVLDKTVENKHLDITTLQSGLYTILITYKNQTARIRLVKE